MWRNGLEISSFRLPAELLRKVPALIRYRCLPPGSKNLVLQQRSEVGHRLLQFFYYDGDILCSLIAADFTDQTLCAENDVSDMIKTAFGNNEVPTWDDFQNFLEERCIPRARAGLREYLEAIGLDEYDPLELIKKTSGRMAEDNQWIKIKVIS